ncbi:MAG: hypothetical protein M1817_003885 [Caeruleum heppii]|nr:MAG: hypothetical protein M1817_003885 [Caeruleum heppii]
MTSLHALFLAYLAGGLTFLPLLLVFILLHAYLTFPSAAAPASPVTTLKDSLQQPGDDEDLLRSDPARLAEKFRSRARDQHVAAGYFAVCREYVPGGVNGKPPERTTPAGIVVATESPSVYQSMYRTIFDRKQGPTIDPAKTARKARNVFFVVLRHHHLMLYDDSEQLEVRHVISLSHHDVGLYAGGDPIPEGELWIRRNAISLTRKTQAGELAADGSTSKPFYLFSENCSDKEDFYFALLQNQERQPDARDAPPVPLHFDVKHVILLVQGLHSSEEHLQTRWVNALIGRLFLALYKTKELEQFVRTKITKKIARVKKPAFLSDIVLQKIDMGEGGPYITHPRLKDLTVDGECAVEADVRYAGNFRLEIAATARLELGSRFKAREVDLVLAVVLKKLEGHVIIRIKPPPSNRMWISFEKMPSIDMSIEPIVSSRQITYNIILRAIESRIREVIAETIVAPHWDDIPFTDSTGKHYRGGIWASDGSAEATRDTNAVKYEIQKEEIKEKAVRTETEPFSSHHTSEKSMSTPALVPSTAASSSPSSAVDEDDVTSSSPEMTDHPRKPRPMRTRSFVSAAAPVVSTDTTTVDAVKRQPDADKHDATSAMMAISHRSPPTSPTESPVVTPTKPIRISEGLIRRPTSSSKGSIDSSSVASQSLEEASGRPSMPSSPSSIGERSSKASLEPGPGMEAETAQTWSGSDAARTPDMRKVNTSIGTATAAAKTWTWGVLHKANELKAAHHAAQAAHQASLPKEGSPDRPIGRGRPLPPLGTPLPHPNQHSNNQSSSRSSILGLPRRKPVAATEASPKEPRRKTSTASSIAQVSSERLGGEQHDDRVFVVAAPTELEKAASDDDGAISSREPLNSASSEATAGGERMPPPLPTRPASSRSPSPAGGRTSEEPKGVA